MSVVSARPYCGVSVNSPQYVLELGLVLCPIISSYLVLFARDEPVRFDPVLTHRILPLPNPHRLLLSQRHRAMSKLSDYSKFDHIGDSSDDEAEQTQVATAAHTAQAATPAHQFSMRPHASIPHRFLFLQNDTHTIYEWEQSLHDLTMYIAAPPTKQKIECTIQAQHVRLGLQGMQQYFLNESTFAAVDMHESTWCKEDDTIVLYLYKAAKGLVWPSPFATATAKHSATLDPHLLTQVQQQLLRERWQEENPGMDFRDAEFQGSSTVPDPRTFMGGVQYD